MPAKVLKEYKNHLEKNSLKFKQLLVKADKVCDNLRGTYGEMLVQHRPLTNEKQREEDRSSAR